MTGTKRTSPDSDSNTRSSKVAKNAASQSTKKTPRKGAKRGTKPLISAEMFKSIASPLHVNLTHTPTVDAGETEVASFDSGSIANVILAPNTFSTGSFGWKGSKRVTVELSGSNGDEAEKVQVMLTINATVVGSKPAPHDAAEESSSESKEDQ